MREPVEKQDPRRMREMFSAIAPRYDFITHALSYGMDSRWKRLGVERAALPENATVLDLACGTGDFALLVLERLPNARVIAADLTHAMLRRARSEGVKRAVCADAMNLPFPNAAFDSVFVGYGLRNFSQLDRALNEIERITRPGGMLVSLDFFLPSNRLLRALYLAYLFLQGAFWGTILHGRPRIYTYIPKSLRTFLSMHEFSRRLRLAGYGKVVARGFVCDGIGLHWAVKG